MPLNIEEEKKFEALRKNCRDLGVPSPPEIHINFEVLDRNGDLIFEDRQRGHSWTRNFYNWLLACSADISGGGVSTFGAGYMSAKETPGTINKNAIYSSRKYSNYATGGMVEGGTYSTSGLGIGTGDTAFSASDYKLSALISNGTGPGQMVYSAQVAAVGTYDSTAGAEKWTVKHQRVFNNNSGAAITVKETGLRSTSYIFDSGVGTFLFERSVLSPAGIVPNGGQFTVSYDISMDFSAID